MREIENVEYQELHNSSLGSCATPEHFLFPLTIRHTYAQTSNRRLLLKQGYIFSNTPNRGIYLRQGFFLSPFTGVVDVDGIFFLLYFPPCTLVSTGLTRKRAGKSYFEEVPREPLSASKNVLN